MEQKLSMEHRMTAVEDRSKSNQHRLEEAEKRLDDQEKLVATVQILADREARVETDVKEIKSDVKSLTEKPAKKWDALWEKVLWAVVAAILGFIFARFGLQ